MINIRRIQPTEWLVAKRVVYRVAHALFNDPLTLEESIAHHESRGTLSDMDDIQQSYFENGGIFLVMTNNDEIICTGAIRRHADEGTCELKRVWLLDEYQGRGLGYRMLQELFAFAREAGYTRMVLETAPIAQRRAYELYKRIGFRDLHPDPEDAEDLVMEIML